MQKLFEVGNINQWADAIQNGLPAMLAAVTRSIMPVVEASLLSLLGSTKEFTRQSGTMTLSYGQDGFPDGAMVELLYAVAAFAVGDIDEEAVGKDSAFINAQITKIPSIKWYPCQIDTRQGIVAIKAVVPMGGTSDKA